MTSKVPPTTDSIDPELTPTAKLLFTLSNADDSDIDTFVEQDTDVPSGALKFNAVINYPDMDRVVRRSFVYWEDREVVLHSEIGSVDDHDVYVLDREWPEYRPDERVYDVALDETFDLGEYVELVGFDDPLWAVTGGFEENLRESHGLKPLDDINVFAAPDDEPYTIDYEMGVAGADRTDGPDQAVGN